MQTRTDEATLRLARLIASERDAKNKLDMLLEYRDEYARRFQQASLNGMTPREWRNFQEFISRLDEAIAAQRQTVSLQEQNTVAGQNNWQQQRQKLKAFDTLSERHFASESAKEFKREQKTQDEFAARPKDEKN
jgi:flagellar FliJ protein